MRRSPLLTAACAALFLAVCVGASATPPNPQKKRKPAAHRTKHAARDEARGLVIYGRREDVMRFGAELAERRGLDREAVQGVLAQARFVPSVARLIMPPPVGTAKNWSAYRARFIEPKRVRAGAAFWHANAAWLALAEQRYGVPAEIVVGIVGVETLYGQHMGGFRVIDALATLAFDFPAGRSDRAPFFRDELENFLLWCQREGLDPLQPKGSYAGAIGMPQFMPSSINQHAVDFDGDGHIDLSGEPADVIGSVAHYLAEHGWQRGLAPRFEVEPPVDTSERATLLVPDILPTFTAQQMQQHGARLEAAAQAVDGPLALVELQNGDAAPSYVAGTRNFYALTRYNWSSYYAMAVIELGEAVKLTTPGAPSALPLEGGNAGGPAKPAPRRPLDAADQAGRNSRR